MSKYSNACLDTEFEYEGIDDYVEQSVVLRVTSKYWEDIDFCLDVSFFFDGLTDNLLLVQSDFEFLVVFGNMNGKSPMENALFCAYRFQDELRGKGYLTARVRVVGGEESLIKLLLLAGRGSRIRLVPSVDIVYTLYYNH